LDTYLKRNDLPPAQAAQIHREAATYHLNRDQFKMARLHLRALARLNPRCALTRYDWGRAFEADPYGCDHRAARCFRRAVKLNASEPKYRASLGRAMVRINEVRSGVKVLCRAADAAPTDVEVLEVVADGLREAGEAGIAFDVLSKALFLAPRNAELKRLWDRARFDMALERQKQVPEHPSQRNSRPKVLPFIRIADDNSQQPTPRHDPGHPPQPHFLRLRFPGRSDSTRS
jgi:Flp pilus assembly protein TadD